METRTVLVLVEVDSTDEETNEDVEERVMLRLNTMTESAQVIGVMDLYHFPR